MTLNVVTCAPDYLPHVGGAEIGLHSLLARSSAMTGHRFSAVVPTSERSLPRREVIDGVEVRRFWRPERSARWYAPTVASTAGVPLTARGLRPDLLHLSYALPTGPGGWLAARLAGVPYVLSIGGNDVADPVYPPPRLLRRSAGLLARHAEHVLCWTTPIRQHVVREWGVERARTSITPFGIDVDAFVPLSDEERGRTLDRLGCGGVPTLLALQRLEARKGVDVLLHATRRALDAGAKFELLIAGTGRQENDLRAEADRLGLKREVRFLGFVNEEEKASLIASVDLFVMPSRHEGQGITLAEAAAAGTAVVATKAGGTVDMVAHGETGLLVRANDAGALSTGVLEALSDPQRLARWGVAARQRAVDTLSIEATSRRFVRILEDSVQC